MIALMSIRQAGREPRAYLLPLLTQPHPSPLSHFISYFVPLSERMFDLQQKAETEGIQSEAKVWSVLVAQVWAGFASYCSTPPDLPLVSVVLYLAGISLMGAVTHTAIFTTYIPTLIHPN